jgi:hypothetical protein
MSHHWRTRAAVTAGLVALVAVGGPRPAAADPIGSGEASSFGITAALAGNELIPPTPAAAVTAPPFGEDAEETLLPIDAAPLAVNATLTASAAVHQASDIPTALEQSEQDLPGPYNARAVGQVEDLEVLIDAVEGGVPLIEADLIRAEAVAVCSAGTVTYSTASEIVNLVIGGQDPLSGPLNELIDQIAEAIEPLAPLADIEIDTDVPTDDGTGVDALVVTLLSAMGDPPLAEIRIGHAEVSGVACGGGDTPECADSADNDGDGVIDTADPGCHSDGDPTNPDTFDPTDDSEGPACADKFDNDGDGVIDAADPGCHTDGDATNAASYDPTDNDEANSAVLGGALPKTSGAPLPATGGAMATGLAAALGAGALGLFALRRRVV